MSAEEKGVDFVLAEDCGFHMNVRGDEFTIEPSLFTRCLDGSIDFCHFDL